MLLLILTSSLNEEDKDIMFKLYDTYNGLIRGKAMKFTKSIHDMNAVESVVVRNMMSRIDQLKDMSESQLTAYISVMTKNACHDFARKKKRIGDMEVGYELVENSIPQISMIEDIETRLDLQAFQKLDEMTAKILFEKYSERATIKEIAKKYSISESKANSIIRSGKKKLKEFWEGKIYEK